MVTQFLIYALIALAAATLTAYLDLSGDNTWNKLNPFGGTGDE